MELLITVIVWGLFGVLAYKMAERRGRNEGGWAVAGVLAGLFAIVLLLILGDTKEMKVIKAKELKDLLS